MSEHGLRFAGIVLLSVGFALWSYGFVTSSFWYANEGASFLEFIRVWLSVTSGRPVVPGVVEEIVGLVLALTGIFLQVVSYYLKR